MEAINNENDTEEMIPKEIMKQLIDGIRNISISKPLISTDGLCTYGMTSITLTSYREKLFALLDHYEEKIK